MAQVDLPTGTIFEVPENMSLTEFERQTMTGKLDPKKCQRVIQGNSASTAIDAMTQNKLSAMGEMKPAVVPVPTDIRSLSPEKQAAVFAFIRSMKEPTFDTTEVTLPPLDLDDAPQIDQVAESRKFEIAAVKMSENPVASVEVKAPVLTEAINTICPNCQWNHSQDPTEVTQADKTNYLRCVLGGQPFTKTYKLFGNKFEVTFRTRPLDVQNLINEQLIMENKDGRIPSAPANLAPITHNMRMRRLNLAAAILNMKGLTADLPELNTQAAVDKYKSRMEPNVHNVVSAADRALFGKWSESLYSAIFKQFNTFENLCYRLNEAAASSDFWVETADCT